MKRGLLFLLLICLLAAWGEASASPLAQEQLASWQVKGRLEPRRFVELSVSQPARIESVLAREDDRVAEGDVLARLDGFEALSAEVDAARLELVLAQQAVDDLQRTAALRLAETTQALRQAEKERAFAADRLASLGRRRPMLDIQAAKANLLLAEKSLEKARKNLRIAQHLSNKRRDIVWYFINRGPYRQYLAGLEKMLAYAERRYEDAKKKVDDLQKPPDEIDVQVAAGELAAAEARLHAASRQQAELLVGPGLDHAGASPGLDHAGASPDPDELAAALARLSAAETRLAAAQADLRRSELRAPISGVVVDLPLKPGEWARPAQRLAVVADLSGWAVQVDELDEELAVQLAPGQAVRLSLDAYPGVELPGVVERVSGYPREEEGEVYYTARILLGEVDLPVRWGMTVRINPK